MKNLVSVCSAAVLALVVTNSFAAPSHIQRDANGGYSVTYDYTDKAKTGWYVGGRVGLSLLNFDNDWSVTKSAMSGVSESKTDSYSFEPTFGGSLVGGFHFNYFWRAELELGYIGEWTDKGEGAELSLSAPYAMANVYYDFVNGFYVGAGAGAALLTTTLDAMTFSGGDRHETSVAPMLGLMAGYSYELDYNLILDLRYRLAGILGHEHERAFIDEGSTYDFATDINWVLENSFTIGLRYEF